MGSNRKRTDKRRIAAMIVAAILVFILLFGTIAPFFAHAGTAYPVEISSYAGFR